MNEIEKAIDFIKATKNARNCKECKWESKCQNDVCSQADELAIAALEKQIPKRVIRHRGFKCPNCGWSGIVCLASDGDDKYCSECGQKLKWSDNDGG